MGVVCRIAEGQMFVLSFEAFFRVDRVGSVKRLLFSLRIDEFDSQRVLMWVSKAMIKD